MMITKFVRWLFVFVGLPVLMLSGGQLLAQDQPLPPATGCVSTNTEGWLMYTVRYGDTLSGIAERANIRLGELVDANCIKNARLIRAGQTLLVPTLFTNDNSLNTVTVQADNLRERLQDQSCLTCISDGVPDQIRDQLQVQDHTADQIQDRLQTHDCVADCTPDQTRNRKGQPQ